MKTWRAPFQNVSKRYRTFQEQDKEAVLAPFSTQHRYIANRHAKRSSRIPQVTSRFRVKIPEPACAFLRNACLAARLAGWTPVARRSRWLGCRSVMGLNIKDGSDDQGRFRKAEKLGGVVLLLCFEEMNVS